MCCWKSMLRKEGVQSGKCIYEWAEESISSSDNIERVAMDKQTYRLYYCLRFPID